MFNLQGKKDYRVASIFGGVSSKGSPYSFITVESELFGGQKYPDRMKINLWGADLSAQIKQGDYIKILGANEVGVVKKKDSKSDKWYENLTITCQPEDVVLGEVPENTKTEPVNNVPTEIVPIDDDLNLPF